MSESRVAYFNTLIFTIVTGVISLGVLALLIFPFGKDYMAFIITFEIGVFIIIGICIYNIVKAENEKSKQKEIYVKFDQCPDAYSRHTSNNMVFCKNFYKVKDASGNDFIARIYPLKDGNNNEIVPLMTFTATQLYDVSASNYTNFELGGIDKDINLKTGAERCQLLFTKPTSSNLNPYMDYNLLPWTYTRSRCASMV